MTDYTKLAKHAVAKTSPMFEEHELYVVWFAKTLQNWKALVSTDVMSGRYWEVTYNGDKGEAYVDLYMKHTNQVVLDKELEG